MQVGNELVLVKTQFQIYDRKSYSKIKKKETRFSIFECTIPNLNLFQKKHYETTKKKLKQWE